MIDHRGKLSSSLEFDDERHWRFTRNTRLPRGYFDRPRMSADAWVLLVCAAIGVGMLAVLIGERL